MARAEDVRELEAMLPWLRADFQAGLAALTDSTAESARRFAADVQHLSGLAAMVPRCANDDVGGTPWTSFRREVAVARSCSDMAAARDLRVAQRLTSCLPRALELLTAGRLSEQRVRAFVAELEVFDDALAGELDELLAEQVAVLPVRRIVELVRKSALELDPDAVAARVAAKTAGRGVELFPAADDQASVVLSGPAVPLTRWFATLDGRARALRQAGTAGPWTRCGSTSRPAPSPAPATPRRLRPASPVRPARPARRVRVASTARMAPTMPTARGGSPTPIWPRPGCGCPGWNWHRRTAAGPGRCRPTSPSRSRPRSG
jgi:hypothetical protein